MMRRGSCSNPAGRFEPLQVEPVLDDGWPTEHETSSAGPSAAGASAGGASAGGASAGGPSAGGPSGGGWVTKVVAEATRRILSRNDSPDVPFDQSLNPYKGCEHGCIYCFARPSHAYLGLSPGLDFETHIVSKPGAAACLVAELSRPSYRVQPIAVGANTDPYQPVERRLRITRSVLEVLHNCDHPVAIVTKSDLVLRDLDLLAPMAERRLAHVYLSVTTLDPALARTMEPRAATPAKRLAAIRALTAAGVPVGVLASPMIPGLNDHELDRILAEACAAGASRAGTILLRLPHELKELFDEWLQVHHPARRSRVLGLIRQTRGGALNESAFGERMRGHGPYAELLQRRFEVAVRRLGLSTERYAFDLSRFRPPAPPARAPASHDKRPNRQLPLF